MEDQLLYGGDEVVHFSAKEVGFKDLVYTAAAHTVVLDFGDKKVNAILQDIQFHPVTDKILHADFYELFDDKLIKIALLGGSSVAGTGVNNYCTISSQLEKLINANDRTELIYIT